MSIISPRCIPLLLFFFIDTTAEKINLRDKVVVAVNCGGKEALGAYGIVYSADYLDDGIASDAGAAYMFQNAETNDVEIYQTERWSKETFDYEVPLGDGEYVIILKFSEVYFEKPGQKIFNVKINSRTVVKNLDIFKASGGRGLAHDVYVDVVIEGDKISINGHSKDYRGKVVIEFAKGSNDNPKVNGFAVLKGTAAMLPPPPEKYVPDDLFMEDFDIYDSVSNIAEDSFNPEIVGDEINSEDEMYNAQSDSENPFEKESLASWLPIIATLVIVIPIAYVIHMMVNGGQNTNN